MKTVLVHADPDAGQKSVKPEDRAYDYLRSEQLVNTVANRLNVRLNHNGKRIVSKFVSDNKQILFTEFGRKYLEFMGLVEWRDKLKVVEKKGKRYTEKRRVLHIPSRGKMVAHLQNKFENLIGPFLSILSPFVVKLYTNDMAVTPRSTFYSKKYYKRLSKYGVNFMVRLPPVIENKITEFLDHFFFDVFTGDEFNFDITETYKEGRWLSHIKTGSNSGYPFNIAQDKTWMMSTVLPVSLKLLAKYVKNRESIDWWKLLFEMGSRTERKFSARVVCMAPAYEKPIGALINTVVDDQIDLIPLPMPRKFGTFDNLAKTFRDAKGVYIAKDWEAYDTSIPLRIFKILADWFYGLGTAFGYLIAFELDLICHAGIIVAENLIYLLKSLPSGIGITQFIGSLIHMLLDYLCGLLDAFNEKVYQSDDTLAKGDISYREVIKAFEYLKKVFRMTISPFGEKSTYDAYRGLVVQKILDDDLKIWFGHEQRNFTNRFFRERVMNVDEDLAQLLGLKPSNKKAKGTLKRIQGARGLLANIASLGVNAPTLPYVLYSIHGKKASFFNEYEITTGLQSLEEWIEEEHKLATENAWLRGYIVESIGEFGWDKTRFGGNFTPRKVDEMLANYGRLISYA